jgi:glycerol-3-phosphate dehydrogenase
MPPSSSSDSPAKRAGSFRRDLARLSSPAFDLLVIGGGSIGTAVARDAALRGMSVALVDREDFGAGTVTRSTRLIHGGLRYLELYDFRLVREALRERETLLRIAPHLVRPLPFLTPIYRGDRWSPLTVAAGMLLYDLLSYDKSLPPHRFLNVRETLLAEPGLRREGLLGGAMYYDAQVASPERLCLAQARSAAQAGAACANHLKIVRLLEEGDRIVGAEAEDALTGQRIRIRAKATVNATGPWAGEIAPAPNGSPRLRRTQGVHLIAPRMTDHAIVLLAERDGRVFFVVPWRDRTMIGTTDTDFSGDPGEARSSEEDVRYLLEETRRVFPQANLSRIDACFAGVRPLLPIANASESQVTREHRIVDHAEEGRPGLISVFGGKITTARDIAEGIVDLVAKQLGNAAPCRTARLPVAGGDLRASMEETVDALIRRGAPKEVAEAWAADYGSEAFRVAEILRAETQPEKRGGLPKEIDPALAARCLYAVREEMAVTVPDLLLRRTLRGYEADRALDTAPLLAEWLGRQFSRSPETIRADCEDYARQADLLTCRA